MKKMAFLFSALFWVMLSASVHAGPAVNIHASALNVRSGPSTNNGKIGLVYSGQKYTREGTNGSWFKIRYDNRVAVYQSPRAIQPGRLSFAGHFLVGADKNGRAVTIHPSGLWNWRD